jgi:hypothetical protein
MYGCRNIEYTGIVAVLKNAYFENQMSTSTAGAETAANRGREMQTLVFSGIVDFAGSSSAIRTVQP